MQSNADAPRTFRPFLAGIFDTGKSHASRSQPARLMLRDSRAINPTRPCQARNISHRIAQSSPLALRRAGKYVCTAPCRAPTRPPSSISRSSPSHSAPCPPSPPPPRRESGAGAPHTSIRTQEPFEAPQSFDCGAGAPTAASAYIWSMTAWYRFLRSLRFILNVGVSMPAVRMRACACGSATAVGPGHVRAMRRARALSLSLGARRCRRSTARRRGAAS